MAEGIPTHSGRRTATVRQLKLLVVVLILSNVALGIFGFHSLRAIDRKYSELISQTVPTLNDMQTLTAISMEAMRSVNPTVFNESANRAEMAQRARVALDRDRILRNAILKRTWLSSGAKERIDFREAGDLFTEKATALIPLLESGKNAEASEQRDRIVRPLFNQYVAATTKAADLLEIQSMHASEALTARGGSISNILLGVAGWPVLALGAIVFSAIVIVLLIRVFLFGEEGAT